MHIVKDLMECSGRPCRVLVAEFLNRARIVLKKLLDLVHGHAPNL